MSKTLKEFMLRQTTGQVDLEFDDDSTSSYNMKDVVTATSDPVTVGINLVIGSGKIGPIFTPATFGALLDGVADDSVAFNAAFNAAKLVNGIVLCFGGKAKLNSGITWDASTTTFIGNGIELDFSGMTTGHAFNITASANGDQNIQHLKNSSNYAEGFFAYGPGKGNTNVDLFYLNDAAGISGVEIRNGGAHSFSVGLNLQSGSFLVGLKSFSFNKTNTPGTQMGKHIVMGAVSFGGERVYADNCFFGPCDLVLDQRMPNGDFYAHNCSFDYFDRLIYQTNGGAHLTNCHIESGTDVDYWMVQTGGSTVINIFNSEIWVAGSKSNYEIGNTPSLNGGIIFDGVKIVFGANTYSKRYLVSGAGRAIALRTTYDAGAIRVPMSAYWNFFPQGGDFAQATALAALSISNASYVTRDTTNGVTGDGCLKIAPVDSSAQGIYPLMSINPGEFPVFTFSYKTTGVAGSGATLYADIRYMDDLGNQVGSATATWSSTAEQSSYTDVRVAVSTPAPAGATKCMCRITVFGRSSGAPVMYVDNVNYCRM